MASENAFPKTRERVFRFAFRRFEIAERERNCRLPLRQVDSLAMNSFQTLGIAVALAADAMIVAFSYGVLIRSGRKVAALKLAGTTGFFQALMPIIGFMAAGSVVRYCTAWDHWIAFVVFGVLGGTIIYNAIFKNEEEDTASEDAECVCGKCVLGPNRLLAIGVATSIDALVVGAGMRCLAGTEAGLESIIPAAGIIGGVTFFGVLGAFGIPRFFRKFPKRIMELVAGLILFSLGLITLIQHLCEETY